LEFKVFSNNPNFSTFQSFKIKLLSEVFASALNLVGGARVLLLDEPYPMESGNPQLSAAITTKPKCCKQPNSRTRRQDTNGQPRED
jgi:hypothetical protein